jgi:hypothetical protein
MTVAQFKKIAQQEGYYVAKSELTGSYLIKQSLHTYAARSSYDIKMMSEQDAKTLLTGLKK